MPAGSPLADACEDSAGDGAGGDVSRLHAAAPTTNTSATSDFTRAVYAAVPTRQARSCSSHQVLVATTERSELAGQWVAERRWPRMPRASIAHMPPRSIAVLTSGGDASGMNAAIRSVVRSGLDRGWRMFGVERGYAGLIDGAFRELGDRDVGGIVHRGGTMLGSARSKEFKTDAGQRRALEQLSAVADALVVIGGNGSQAGARALSEAGFPVVGIASTIDNDLRGAEISIGVDTALGVALESIDRLRVTAASHRRAFVIEVMGRDSGYLALMAGIAGGAEAIVIPENPLPIDTIATEVRAAYGRGKSHAIVVVAEGVPGGGAAIAEQLRSRHGDLGFEMRVTVLGHVQRGGVPSPFDRLLGSRSGYAAVEALARGEHGVLIGQQRGELKTTPLDEVAVGPKPLDPAPLELARVLAR